MGHLLIRMQKHVLIFVQMDIILIPRQGFVLSHVPTIAQYLYTKIPIIKLVYQIVLKAYS